MDRVRWVTDREDILDQRTHPPKPGPSALDMLRPDTVSHITPPSAYALDDEPVIDLDPDPNVERIDDPDCTCRWVGDEDGLPECADLTCECFHHDHEREENDEK